MSPRIREIFRFGSAERWRDWLAYFHFVESTFAPVVTVPLSDPDPFTIHGNEHESNSVTGVLLAIVSEQMRDS